MEARGSAAARISGTPSPRIVAAGPGRWRGRTAACASSGPPLPAPVRLGAVGDRRPACERRDPLLGMLATATGAATLGATSTSRTEPCARAEYAATCGNVTLRSSGLTWNRSETSTSSTKRLGRRKVLHRPSRTPPGCSAWKAPELPIVRQIGERLVDSVDLRARGVAVGELTPGLRRQIPERNPLGLTRGRGIRRHVDRHTARFALSQEPVDLCASGDIDVQAHAPIIARLSSRGRIKPRTDESLRFGRLARPGSPTARGHINLRPPSVPCGSSTNFFAAPLSKSWYPCGALSSEIDRRVDRLRDLHPVVAGSPASAGGGTASPGTGRW